MEVLPLGSREGQSSDKRSGDKSPEAGDILQMEESKVLKRSWRFYTVRGRRGRRGEAVRPAHQCLQSVGSERRCPCQTDSFNASIYEHITLRDFHSAASTVVELWGDELA